MHKQIPIVATFTNFDEMVSTAERADLPAYSPEVLPNLAGQHLDAVIVVQRQRRRPVRKPHRNSRPDALVNLCEAHCHLRESPARYAATNIDADMVGIHAVGYGHCEPDNDVHAIMGVRHDADRDIGRNLIVQNGIDGCQRRLLDVINEHLAILSEFSC